MLEFCQAALEGLKCVPNLLFGETPGDVLRTIPVKSLYSDQVSTLDNIFATGFAKTFNPIASDFPFEDLGTPQNLQARAGRIVHHDQCDPCVAGHVACADVLPVSTKIREGDGPRVDYL